MKRNIKGYMIAVPDKDNPDIVKHYHVKGPKFLYGNKIVKEYEYDFDDDFEDDSEGQNKKKMNKKTKKERKVNKSKAEKRQKTAERDSGGQSTKPKSSLESHIIAEIEKNLEEDSEEQPLKPKSSLESHIIAEIEKNLEEDEGTAELSEFENAIEAEIQDFFESSEEVDLILDDSDEIREDLRESSLAVSIAREIAKIMDEDDDEFFDSEEAQMEFIPFENNGNTEKRTVLRPKTQDYIRRYTAPKERGLIARIINRIKYEKDWYEDIECYLDDNYYAYEEIEQSRISEKRREQRLYKKVQAYEDARDDITMRKAFIGVKATAAAALLTTTIYAGNLLVDMVKDIVTDNNYVAAEQVKSTLENANSGEIAYAEKVLSKIDYEFEYLSRDELVDTIIRVGTKPSKITENRAMGTLKSVGNYGDQKLLEEIVREAYESEYDDFSDEKKRELNQVIYEMLDENIKVWIRSPENVAKLKEKKDAESAELNGMEY